MFCPEGVDGLHTFTNQSDEPARILAIGAGRFPGGDKGIIARSELPAEQ